MKKDYSASKKCPFRILRRCTVVLFICLGLYIQGFFKVTILHIPVIMGLF